MKILNDVRGEKLVAEIDKLDDLHRFYIYSS
jgi:hypothetical protein